MALAMLPPPMKAMCGDGWVMLYKLRGDADGAVERCAAAIVAVCAELLGGRRWVACGEEQLLGTHIEPLLGGDRRQVQVLRACQAQVL